ncbi:hypothetical protein FE257_002710 [Aspergillus nanangensis]|uniref:Ketoreductase domain-containing protein n=1 Tax=Aspergillus nanangensis TaxID=2582783 RepID=A0AAD4CCP2_ASPNN|nr:hypothetical protein FE257_002710 [Aspergillus nanangensis]
MVQTTTTTNLPLSGKVALVTGGGRGIGAGIALELARKGASIAINYAHNSTSAQETANKIRALGPAAEIFPADLTDVSNIESLLAAVVDRFGRLDIVMSNSGAEKFRALEDTTPDDFSEVFNLNTRAQFFVAAHAFPYIQPGGRVILMSSISVGVGVPGHALYAGSKAAVEGFTRSLAADFGRKGCTVNAIAPGGVKSDMWTTNSWRYAPGCDKTSSLQEIEQALAAGSPLNRCGEPEDIGRIVAFLASPDSEWVNGQIIPVNGGANI